MLPAPLKNPSRVPVIAVAAGAVPASAVRRAGIAITPANPPSLYVVVV